ncbi:LOW QUALITY PROTEIN: uncharacterized protein LOC117573223 [Drosophila albomicans]|uniref:LOW QUALITY PROTEIN: uncharacterized protein LOC117573223 n=1 Tax=Drosophila albomicans TaxID=7291 RepID=A0A6P8Z6F8_DROAB|nr:LOW QUALITY PROTEIN: uncharacterized protein LOC117573223 [Drosophila albomicans]
MPMQNEQNAEIIKSIWNYNKFEIGGIGGQLRHGLVQGARQIYSIKGEASKHLSKYYIVFNLLNIKRERELAIQQLKRLRTHVMYLSYTLTKLCLIIVLLLPFLSIQQTNAQNILDPIPLSIANSNSVVNSFKIIRNKTHQAHQIPKTIRRNPLSFYEYYNNHSNGKENGYSLIILSQSKHFYAQVVHEANNKFLSTNSVQNVNSFTSASTNRTKRYINVKDSTASIHKIINKKEASSQILKSTSGEHKNNHNIYKNSKNSQDKLTKLVMNGLGLKKLPDMKKANISQIEYSRKYIEYLERLRKREIRKNNDDGDMENTATHLQIYSIVTSKFKDITRKRRHSSERAIRSTKHFKNSHRRVGNHNKLEENDKTNILLHFPLMVDDAQFNYEQINEANVRLMILYNPSLAIHSRSVETDSKAFRRKSNNRYYKKHAQNGTDCKNDHINNYPKSKTFIQKPKPNNSKRKKHILNLKVYQLLRLNKRQILDGRQIEFDNDLNYSATRGDETYSQWLEFDVTVAVRSWLNKSRENLGIEIQCDKCKRIGARILSEVSTLNPHLIESTSHHIQDQFHLTPVLNIIGQIGRTHSEEAIHPQTLNLKWNNQSHNDYFYHRYGQGQGSIKKLPNSCYRAHQRCCRHQLDVDFKNIKGFEFIIQPKTFDAGYCKGRCPPRHNPAHHHALLQSLIWQQDHNRVPRPCCVPSKLTEIEILHVDEEHSDKLKYRHGAICKL